MQHQEDLMISAGLLLTSDTIRIVTLAGTREQHKQIATKVNKLELGTDPDQEGVEAFCHTFQAFCADNAIDMIVINRRATSGRGAGGGETFRTEGILLTMCLCPIKFVHPATMRATDRKHSGLKAARPSTKDLSKAYDLAFEGLP
jgi:hypothetical protein